MFLFDRLASDSSYFTLFYVRAVLPRVRKGCCASFVAPQPELLFVLVRVNGSRIDEQLQ
jgi:hypothetical protein